MNQFLNKGTLRSILISLHLILLPIFANGSDTLSDKTPQKYFGGIQLGIPSGLSVFHEQKVFAGITIKVDALVSLGYSSVGSNKKQIHMNPGFSIEPRWYYNINKRSRMGRNTLGFSANYLSFNNKLLFHEFDNSFTIAPYWGMRRMLGEKFHFEFGVGITKLYRLSQTADQNKSEPFYPMLNLKIGFNLY